jgi:tryptophanase
MSHFEYAADRLGWLLRNRDLVKGLTFIEEPPVLRFFFGKLAPKDNWGERLVEAYEQEFGDC